MFAEPLIDPLRELLMRIGYSCRALEELTGVAAPIRGAGANAASVLEALADGGDLGTVAACLWLGLPQEPSRLAQAIAPMTTEQWQQEGLIERRGDGLAGAVMVVPWEDVWLVTDRPERARDLRADYVMAVGGGTEVMRAILIRRSGARVLDLGSGCGSLSLLAGRFASEACGIELNPRGVAFAEAAARLNDLPTCRFEARSFFELEDRHRGVDLVISQPPFVISPSRELVFRDADGGDDSVWRAVDVATGCLAEGGVAELVINWLQPRGGDPFARAREHFADVECDVFVAHSKIEEPGDYARAWVDDEAELPVWLDYYDKLGVEAICSGVAVMRKRLGGPGFRHFTELPETMSSDAHEHILDILEGSALLERSSTADLLALCPRPRAHLHVTPTKTVSLAGLHYEVNHDPLTAAVIRCCDGETSLRAMAETIAVGHRFPLDRTVETLLGTARTWISHGLLLGPD